MFKLDLEKLNYRGQLANIRWIIKKARVFQEYIYFCFIVDAKALDCMDHSKMWKIMKEMGILDHLTCLLRNLYADQEATVRTGYVMTDWFQNGKGIHQGCIMSPCLFNLYAEYIMWNARLDEVQAGIKITGRNSNNLRYADNANLMAESEEALKSILMKVKEESKNAGLKLNIQKTKIMVSGPNISWQMDEETMGSSNYFLGFQNHCRWWLQPWIKRRILIGRKAMTNLDSILKSRDLCQKRSV